MTKKQNETIKNETPQQNQNSQETKQNVPAFRPEDFKVNVRLRNDHAYILADVDIIYGCMKMSGAHIMDGKRVYMCRWRRREHLVVIIVIPFIHCPEKHAVV